MNALRRKRRALKRQAKIDPAVHDYGTSVLPPGFALKGVSQHVDSQGNVKTQWIKSERDKAAQTEMMLEALRDMAEGYTGVVKPTKAPGNLSRDLMTAIPIGDAHFGLHCWAPETGVNFDLKIAEDITVHGIASLLKAVEPADHAVLINVGDYFHADGDNGSKTTKGTPVDTDSRWPKILETGLSAFQRSIDMALATHNRVTVICAVGNHDAQISVMLATFLSLMYKNEPRVFVDTRPTKFHYVRHGACLLGITHGDTTRGADLPLIMAGDMASDWAETLHRLWYTGHVHHDTVKDYRGATVETVRTLVPADKWHVGQGYRSMRDIKADTWHTQYGRIGRVVRNIIQIEHEIEKATK